MEEQKVSFVTAKLAKEKGFRDYSSNSHWYNSEGDLIWDHGLTTKNDYPAFSDEYDAPTQSLLQRWLREEHHINVESNYLPNIQYYRCLFIPMSVIPKNFDSLQEYKKEGHKYISMNNHKTYEGALEEGLQKALKLIKKENDD